MIKQTDQKSLIKAIHHIRLAEVNDGKLAELDALWVVYKPLCEQYIRLFCTQVMPDAQLIFCFDSQLSARWQREAVRQAAGISHSWRSNHAERWEAYQDKLAWYESLPEVDRKARRKPTWNEPRLPELREVSIQASQNVALQVEQGGNREALKLEKATGTAFDFWLRLSTLHERKPVYLPVRLARHHRLSLDGRRPNSSVTLARRDGWWWLSLSVSEPMPAVRPAEQVVGLDVGIANFLTDSEGHYFGTAGQDFMKQVERVKAKISRKAKLRACLKKNGVSDDQLPSTTSAQSQRLARRVKHDIETAVVACVNAHPDTLFVIEKLNVSGMRFKARQMNRYLKASQIGHIQEHLYWTARKRGIAIVSVPAAYSSQGCPVCDHADRANRPNQQTFCCQVCGYSGYADVVAAVNLKARLDDTELGQCHSKEAVKALLNRRHAAWLATQSPGQVH